MSGSPVCAIDCGTNSTRLLIVSSTGETIRREMRITRLGQGVDATGTLSEEACARTLGVLAAYRSMMDEAGVAAGRLAATSAARDAANGPAFLEAASEIVGVEAEILSGEEEGRLSFAGAMEGLEPADGDDLVLDIGGGSTEIVLSRHGQLRSHSMQLGCVRVSERELHGDPPSSAELAAAREMADLEIDRAIEQIPELGALGAGSRLVGLAGTVATLAMLDLGLGSYDPDVTHHRWLSRAAVDGWCDLLAGETSAARAQRAGMVPGREDVILGGLVVLSRVLHRLGLDGLLSSETDILDGLAASVRRP